MHDQIEEMKKKCMVIVKEKALLKLEKDKLTRSAHELQTEIKMQELKVQKSIEKRRRDDSPKYSASGSQNANEGYGSSTLGKS